VYAVTKRKTTVKRQNGAEKKITAGCPEKANNWNEREEKISTKKNQNPMLDLCASDSGPGYV
jgi:hypothetical protein